MPGQFDYLTEMCYWKRAMKVYQTVKDILAKHTGTPTFNLPNEGKDIRVHYIEFIQTDENDFKWEQNTLKWGNDTFTEIVGEAGYS